MKRLRGAALRSAAAMALLAACSDDATTRIDLVVQAEVDGVSSLRLRVENATGTTTYDETRPFAPGDIARLPITPTDADDASFVVIAETMGAPLALRVRTAFVAGEVRELDLRLALESCDPACGPEESCVAGVCDKYCANATPPGSGPTALRSCDDMPAPVDGGMREVGAEMEVGPEIGPDIAPDMAPECRESRECTGPTPTCAQRRCDDGVCMLEVRPGDVCPPGSTCNPERGCVSDAMPTRILCSGNCECLDPPCDFLCVGNCNITCGSATGDCEADREADCDITCDPSAERCEATYVGARTDGVFDCAGANCRVIARCGATLRDIDCTDGATCTLEGDGGGGRTSSLTARCDGVCELEGCGEADCELNCTNSARCEAASCSRAANCDIECSGSGSTCSVTECSGSADCDVECPDGGTCSLGRCRGGGSCDLVCGGDNAACELGPCSGGTDCTVSCPGAGSTCAMAECSGGGSCDLQCPASVGCVQSGGCSGGTSCTSCCGGTTACPCEGGGCDTDNAC
ncbi:MAG: hypothetical protein AAF938_10755 [Myxococcota bacterium]